MTSLAEERAEQKRWTARLRRPMPFYDRLLENEFLSGAVQQARLSQSLARMLDYAARHVPHYGGQFAHTGIGPRRDDPFAVLSRMPILTKHGVRECRDALIAETRPAGEQAVAWKYSSGTTGRPTAVLHSLKSTTAYAFIKQREYRWFRLDPAATLAAVRLPSHLPSGSGGEAKSGETVRSETWPYLADFLTGPFIGISAMTPADQRIAWLHEQRPDYLIAYAETLEHLAFAAAASPPEPRLRAIVAISEQLTSGMRMLVERTFGAPIHQNYGLNEIGFVASRCEAGRYHVHTEHCHVEIADEEGRPSPAGSRGRILVTALTNFAMPLIRYDTGDYAQALAGPCPCGRSLPSFGEIAGRYSRAAYLPPATIGCVLALRTAIEEMPQDLVESLREFQIHQFRDKRMELRFVAHAPMPEEFTARLRAVWSRTAGEGAPELIVRPVDAIARSPGGKFQVFTSDFMPPPDA